MDKFTPTGHLEVWKIYDDETEELHFEEQNVITSGMGVGLAKMFAGSGAATIENYQILNFQAGVSGDLADYGVSTYKLKAPLTAAQYGSLGSELLVEGLRPVQSSIRTAANLDFARIPFTNIQKVSPTSVRFVLYLDKNTANGISHKLNEVGLFMRNPTGITPASPILVAYRPFTSLRKTSTFALLFKWTLQF